MKKHIKTLKKKLKIFDPKLKEECGIFGISNTKDASALTALGLHALQHRGQEGCGIVTFNGKQYFSEKRFGLVGDNFNKEKILKKVNLPTATPTCLTFGGPDSSNLFVTSLRADPINDNVDGNLYKVETSTKGLMQILSEI